MRIGLLAASFLALMIGGCSDLPKTWRQSEIEEIAANQAEDFADAASDTARIDELQQRIEQVEQENRNLESRLDSMERQLLLM